MSEELNITVKSSGDKKYSVSISPQATILELKEKIATESDVPAGNQRLIYSGRVLKDADTVENYKIQSGHTIHLVRSGASRPSPSAAASSVPAEASAAAPSNIASGQGGAAQNPFLALTNLQNLGYNVPMPPASMFGSDGGMTSMPDENSIADMLEQPGVQSMMNQMLSDPAMIDMMIQQSPQLRNMGPMAREMLQSDYMRQMLTNPQMLRSVLAMNRAMGGASAPGGSFPAPGPTGLDTSTTESTNGASSGATDTNANPTTLPADGAGALPNPFAAFLQAASGANGGDQSQNPLGGLFGAFPPPAAGGANPNPFLNPDLLNLFMGGNALAQQPLDNRPPEERYESQLRQLNDMGFSDFERNVTALRRSGGSVQGAVEALLSGNI